MSKKKEEEKEPAYTWVQFDRFVATEPGTNRGYQQGEVVLFPTGKANEFIRAKSAHKLEQVQVAKERNHGDSEG